MLQMDDSRGLSLSLTQRRKRRTYALDCSPQDVDNYEIEFGEARGRLPPDLMVHQNGKSW